MEAEATLEQIIEELDLQCVNSSKNSLQRFVRNLTLYLRNSSEAEKEPQLMEDEDILEAGIRIIAQPPGKKAAEL